MVLEIMYYCQLMTIAYYIDYVGGHFASHPWELVGSLDFARQH
jgi:hypothetical protein